LTKQFYDENEMAIRGFSPKPILSFDEIQFPGKNLLEKKPILQELFFSFDSKCYATTGLYSTNTYSIPSLAYSIDWK
jgi:hypothetical protein